MHIFDKVVCVQALCSEHGFLDNKTRTCLAQAGVLLLGLTLALEAQLVNIFTLIQ